MPEKTPAVVEATATSSKNPLMSVSELLSASWTLLTQTWKKLLVLSIIVFLITFVVGIGYGLLVGVSLAGVAIAKASAASVGIALTVGGISTVIMFLIMVAVQSALMVGIIRTIADPTNPKNAWQHLTGGFGVVVPLIFGLMLVGFLSVGGYFLFFIPGVIITILLSMVMYEIILQKSSIGEAMKNSATIVSQNFGFFFVRWLVVIGISILYSMITMFMSVIPGLSMVVNLLNMIVSVLVSWYFVTFWYLAYSQARANTNFSKQSSLVWMYIVGIIGWILMILTIMAVGGTVMMAMEAIGSTKDSSEKSESLYKYDQDSSNAWGSMSGDDVQVDGKAIFDQMLNDESTDLTEEERQQLESLKQMFETDSTPAPTN